MKWWPWRKKPVPAKEKDLHFKWVYESNGFSVMPCTCNKDRDHE